MNEANPWPSWVPGKEIFLARYDISYTCLRSWEKKEEPPGGPIRTWAVVSKTMEGLFLSDGRWEYKVKESRSLIDVSQTDSSLVLRKQDGQRELLHLPIAWALKFPPPLSFRDSQGWGFSIPLSPSMHLSLSCPPLDDSWASDGPQEPEIICCVILPGPHLLRECLHPADLETWLAILQ